MSTPTIHLVEVESLRAVEVTNSDKVKVSIRTETCYTMDSDRRTQKVFVVDGTVSDKGRNYPVTWEFVCPEDLKTPLAAVLTRIRSQIMAQQSGFVMRPNLEIYSALTDWLRVGWKQTHSGFNGYLRFTQGELSLEAKLENLRSFEDFQSQFGY